MKIKNITSTNFRCIKKETVDFDQLNIVFGDNGQGKTSLLESVYMLAFTRSHKTNNEKEAIQKNESFLGLKADIEVGGFTHNVSLNITNDEKKAQINHNTIHKLSEFVGFFNVVLFSPDDLTLIKGEPNNRRRFLDLELGQINKMFIHDLLMYKAILKQRNELLKKITDSTSKVSNDILLDTLTEQLASYGSKIQQMRSEFIDSLNDIIVQIHHDITGGLEELKILYTPKSKGNLYQEMKERLEYDVLRGSTSFGPHRDDFSLFINGEDASKFGSQGQQRSAILSLKLALISFIKTNIGEYPILLLDDVFSELDEQRLTRLLEYLNPEIQTIISTTDLKLLHKTIIDKANLIYVRNGKFEAGETHE